MSIWLKKFRQLPEDAQQVASMVQIEDRIDQFKRERTRLSRRYKESVAEINSRIKNLEKSLEKKE